MDDVNDFIDQALGVKTKLPANPYDDLIEESASRYDIDPDFVRAVATQESAWKPKARSPKGASGLMQLMPATARNLGIKNIYDPKENIEGGTKYLRQLLDMFGGDVNLALAGYNAGEGAVQKYGNKIPPYRETQNYVKKITGNYKGTGYRQPVDVNSFIDSALGDPPAPDNDVNGFIDQVLQPTDPPQTVPESPDAMQSQIISTFDVNSPKSMTLLPKGNPANNYFLNTSEAKRLTRVDTPDGIVLVNAKKLGIKPSEAKDYVKKNGFAKDSGFVIDMGNATGDGQPAVAAVDPNTGKEVFAAVTPTPESAQLQAQQNQAMFPGTVQVPTNTDEVAANRMAETPLDPNTIATAEPYQGGAYQGQLPDGFGDQPDMPDAPVAQATDADFNTANEYLKSVGQPLLTREQFDVAQKTVGKSAQATGYATQAPQQRQITQKGQPTSPAIAQGKSVNPTTSPQSQKYADATYELSLSNKNGSYKSSYYDEAASRLSSELNVPYEVARSVVEQNPIKFTDGSEADDTYFAEVAKTGKSINAQIGGSVKRQIVDAAKQVADKQKLYREKLDEYAKSEAPSVADLMARKDAGLGITDDEIKAERDAYQKALEEKGLTGTVQDPYAAGIASGELSPETRRAIRIDINAANADLDAKRQKFAQDILKDSGSFVKYQKDKERLKDEYANRPLAEPLEFAKNLAGAIPKALASVLKTGDLALNMNPLKLVYDQATGRGFKIDETGLSDIGNNINQYIEKNRNPDLKDKWYINMLPDTIGQLATQITAGVLTGGATVPTLIGASMGAAAQYDEAKKFNADDKQKMTAAVVGALAAIPDALLFSKWFKGADEVAQTGFIKSLTQSLMSKLGVKYGEEVAAEVTKASIKQFAGNILKNAGFEGVQEVSENKINDWLALNTFDPSTKRREKLLSISDDDVSSFVGGLIGGAGGGGVQAYTENLAVNAQEDLFEKSQIEVDRLLEKGEITPAKAAEIKAVVAQAAEDANKGAGKPAVNVENVEVKPKSEKPKVTLEPVEDIAKSDKVDIPAKAYPVADPPEYTHSNYKEQGGKIINATPDEFLSLARDLKMDDEVRDNVDDLKRTIESGRKVDPATIYLKDGEIVGHDGRHRAIAAQELGIKDFPILVLDEAHKPVTAKSLKELNLSKQATPKPQPTKPIATSPVRERAKAKASEKFGVKGEAADEKPQPLSNTQIEFSPEQAKPFDDFRKNIIDPKDVADKSVLPEYAKDGIFEIEPHVTVKYGLHTNNHEDVIPQLQGEKPIAVELGKTSVFKGSEKKIPGTDKPVPYDVVTVEVKSPDLERLNKKLTDGSKNTTTFPYSPHVTLAYVKSGEGEKYAGKTDFEGQKYTFDGVTFSPADKSGKQVIPLAQPKAEAVKEPHEMTLAEAQVAKVDSELPKNIVLSDFGGNYITKEKNGAYKVWKYTDGGSTSLAGTIGFKGDVGLERAKQRLAKLSADSHKLAVSRAVRDGKTVPQEVLSEYPDLAKLATRKAERATNLEAAKQKVADRKADVEARKNERANTILGRRKRRADEASTLPIDKASSDNKLDAETPQSTSAAQGNGESGATGDKGSGARVRKESVGEVDDTRRNRSTETDRRADSERLAEGNRGGQESTDNADDIGRDAGRYTATRPGLQAKTSQVDSIGVVRVERLPKSIYGDASVPKSNGNALTRDAHLLRSLTQSKTFRNEGLSGFNVPSQRRVMNAMLRRIQDLKVRNIVIQFIPVNVVDALINSKGTPQMSLHDKSVLKNAFAIQGKTAVSIRSDVADALIVVAAGDGTKGFSRRENLILVSAELSSTVETGKVRLGHDTDLQKQSIVSKGESGVESDSPTSSILPQNSSENILRSVADTPFYSRVESVIRDKMPPRATSAQVTALLAKNSVKELDPEFQALKVWLEDQGSVSKDDVLAFVAANRTAVSEVVKGRTPTNDTDYSAVLDGFAEARFGKPYSELSETQRLTALEETEGSRPMYVDDTSFSQWQLPGESENYREEFITAPAFTAEDTYEVRKMHDEKMGEYFTVWNTRTDENAAWGYPQRSEESMTTLAESFNKNAKGRGKLVNNWQDGHEDYNDVVNPIARIRYNDRTTTDGDKMLFGEEFQQPSKENLAKMPKVYQKFGEQMAIRKMLYRAVEGGYDYFGFTTGQQQADRYDLSKQVKAIKWLPSEAIADTTIVRIFPNEGSPIAFTVDGNGKVSSSFQVDARQFEGKDLVDVVGKDAAAKIAQSAEGRLEGLDLKVGGEGLINRYDRKHVDYINKLMKPYGVSVESKSIVTEQGNNKGDWAFRDGRIEETKFGDFDLFGTRKDTGEEAYLQNFDTRAEAERELKLMQGDDSSIQVHAVRISPEFRKAVEASIREHGGAFPLFKVAEPTDIADIEALGKGDFKELFNDIKSDVKSDATGANILDLGTNKTIELVRTAFAYMYDTPLEGTAIPGGMYLDPSQTNDFRDALQGISDAASENGVESKGVDTLIKNLDKAAKDGDVRVIGFDDTLPHETIHQQSRRGAIDKELSQRYSDDGLGDDRVFKKFHKKLIEIQGKASLAVAREEALAYLSSGDYARFGLTEAEATEIVARIIESYANKNGVESLKTFNGTQAYEAVENYYRKIESRETSNDSRSGVSGERETRPSATQTERAENDTGERGETFTPAGEEKLSKTPSTLRKGGIPVQERLYTSTTDAERQSFANERMDDGLDAAMKWTRDQLDTKNNNAGATGVVGVNVMVQLGKEGRIAELNKFADDLLPAYTDSAQMIQSLAVVSMFSPDTAGAYVTKVAKQNGQDVTPEQVEKALDIAGRMSEVVQADGITQHALDEAKAESERLKQDIADLTEALGLANDKNKQFKGKLSGQGRTIAALRRQIEGETKSSTRLPGAVKKHVKEIVERKDDILERLKQKYGGNPILQMVAPSQNVALRSTPDTAPLDQDAVDAATYHLSKNLGKQTPAQVKDAINVLTNGQMTPQQIDDVYAAAVSALRIERTAMDADTKAANKLRQGHYREADKINDAKLTEWEKKLSKPDTKFVNMTVREGVENGYTDEAIWFALARKHHPNVNDALKALREEFPEADQRTIIRDSERLTQAVKNRITADIAQRQNQFTLNDEDIALIKEERRVNTHEKQKVVREANRFYSGMVKDAGEIILDTIVNFRRANLLTAIKTHFVNIGGNVGFAMGEEIARAPSTVVDLAASIFTGERTTTLSAKAIGHGLKALVAQDETLKNSKWETPEGKERGITAAKHVLQYGGSIADMERLQHSESILSAKFENRAARWMDNYINGVFKTLGAEDAFFKVYAFRRHIEEQARAIAITERRQDKSINLKERIKELIANPTNVMQVQADRYAHFMTFQNDNALSGFIASIKRGRPGLKAGVETIMPYDRTPTNIVMRVMEYTPAGMVIAPIRWKGAQRSFDRNKPPGLKFRNELTGAVKADLAQSEDFNSLPETERRKIVEATLQKVFTREQQETFAKTIGRSSLGTGLFSLGFVMAAAGLMAGAMSFDDDDKTESSEAEKRKKAGIENGSIQTPWGRIVLPKSPPTAIMTAGATFYEQMALSKKSPLIAAVDAGVEAFGDMAKEVPLINSTSSVLRSLGKGKFGEFTGNIVSGFVPASAMLNALSNLTDDKERTGSGYKKGEKIKSPEQYLNYQGRGLRNSFIKGIPWLRQYADESTSGVSDIERGGIGRRIVRILDPFNTRTEAPPQPGTVKEMIDGVVTYAKAIGTDPITAFKIIYKGERIRRVDNNTIIVERMDFEDSKKVKKDRNAQKDERLDHKMPLQLGGLNDEDNLELRPINDWARFTPIENALGRALRSEKITKEEAQKLMRQYKDGEIAEADITSFKNGAVTITAGDKKPRTDLDPKNPIGNQSAVQKFKEIGSVDGLLKNNSVRYWSTDDWVAVMDAADLTDADRQLASDTLRKKADNAQKAKSLTPEELERVKSVLPDYAPKQPKSRKLIGDNLDTVIAPSEQIYYPKLTGPMSDKWKTQRQSQNVIDRQDGSPLSQFIGQINDDVDSIQQASFSGGTLAERREAKKALQEQIAETKYVLKNKSADPVQARKVLRALLGAQSRVR